MSFEKHIKIANPQKNNCSGCSACEQSCPKSCITMQMDSEGFFYPNVDESTCIDCGLCSSVCPWTKEKISSTKDYPKVFAVKHKSDKVRLSSTSGGVFTALAENILSKGGEVYGAAFVPEKKRVEYVCAKSLDEIKCIRGSKYVQSYIGDTYSHIRKSLKNGTLVLFTGTPCHCSGLIEYLRKPYDNLYVVDILCHSTPSPLILENVLKKNEDILGESISNIIFRDKTRGWRNSYHCVIYSQNKSIENSSYLTLFFKGLINRPSCYNCKFTSTNRPSDMTIGDYWNIHNVDRLFEDDLGVNCVLVNNKHGFDLFSNVSNDINSISTTLEPSIQKCMKEITGVPLNRNYYWQDFNQYGFDYCEKKYGAITLWDKIRHQILSKLIKMLKLDPVKKKLIRRIS